MKDALGIDIQVGDNVMVTAWGGNVRLTDVRRTGTVTAIGRARPVIDWDSKTDQPRSNVRPGYVTVLRRDGGKGFQGNANN